MPAFTDLDKADGVAKLNDFLASASFVDGYVPPCGARGPAVGAGGGVALVRGDPLVRARRNLLV